MAYFVCIVAFLSITVFSTATSATIIQDTCKASRDPSTCQAWLSHSNHVPPNATVLQVIQSALNFTNQNLDSGRTSIQKILNSTPRNVNRTRAANNCLELVRYSKYRVNLVGASLKLKRAALKDARAWLSAAMVYQYDCWSALKYVNDTALIGDTMSFFNDTLISGTSSVLGMLVNYDVFGDVTASWRPVRTERDGFWEPTERSSSAGELNVPAGLTFDATVCKNGCRYKTVQDAVNGAPNYPLDDRRFVIWIKAGVYEETVRVPLEKTNVMFVGAGKGKTVITGSANVGQPGMTTYASATVGVLGDGFMAIGLTIQNTAGPDAHQAVAFRSDSDKSVIQDCEFIGNQDTLYAHSLRQYYKSCVIQGNVDFIFGNSATVFEDCQIFIAPRQQNPEHGETNTVTAHGRIDPAQSTGFVFRNCLINGTGAYNVLYHKNPKVHKNYLGRPWKAFSRTVFVECVLEGIVSSDGWMPWDGDFALSTLYYGEFQSSGAGSNRTGRVPWSSQVPINHVGAYSIESFIQADHWK